MLLSAGQWHGDTAFQLKRIRQRRQQVEAAEDFPVSGAGIKLQQVGQQAQFSTLRTHTPAEFESNLCLQERLAASAAAASSRNKALQQSLAEVAQRPTAAGSMDAQVSCTVPCVAWWQPDAPNA